jgi:hypothetical protein
MNKQINTINKVSGTLGTIQKLARGRAVVAAAVLGLAAAVPAQAMIADATQVSTTLLAGLPSEVDNVSGGATYGATTSYRNTNTYDMHYAGDDLRVDSITADNGVWTPVNTANAVVRRFDGPTTDIVWYAGEGNTSAKDQYALAGQVGGFEQAFSGNNLLVGTDNLFGNRADSHGNNTNVERLDMLFFGGFQAASTSAFTIFDRGFNGQHDGFKIAAITGLDSTGKPSNYGPLMSFTEGAWGNTDVVGPTDYVITRRDNTVPNDPWHPSTILTQSIGGVVIPTSDLVAAGTTIYGYSLFAADTTGSGTQLDNWTNTGFYPTNTDSNQVGGLDAIGTAAVLYTSVPEPSAAVFGVFALGALLVRRSKRDLA